jgi:hypothetical protein
MKEGEHLSEDSQIKLAAVLRTVCSIKCRREAAVVQASLLMLILVSNLEKLVVRSLKVKQPSIHSIQTVAAIKCWSIIQIPTQKPSISIIQMWKE